MDEAPGALPPEVLLPPPLALEAPEEVAAPPVAAAKATKPVPLAPGTVAVV